MALSRTYLTVNGQIRSEHRSGETQSRDYMHDALGSVVVVYQNNSFVADGSYSCLGRLESGSWNIAAQGYKFAWNGGHGYRQTGVEWSSTYVRARHYSFMDGAWTTRDPLWPDEMPYNYVNGMGMSAVDPSGKGCISTRIHIPKFSAMSIELCPRNIYMGSYWTLDWDWDPLTLIPICNKSPKFVKHDVYWPCSDYNFRLYMADADKATYFGIPIAGAGIACLGAKTWQAKVACELIIAAIGIMLERCRKKNGDVCVEGTYSTCPLMINGSPVPLFPPGSVNQVTGIFMQQPSELKCCKGYS